ncbi:hypothetical protein VFPBJ_11417 [Purpureocillium lilacinum]|uniref:Uncharacterized protein n=1 Tax=Purpureocillium lilacinum TaxID=33203 RepID=A0A179FAM0_PURLI|nr:hypothetical protein VFPBJ_11417 [Purpureocillium lilacinum]
MDASHETVEDLHDRHGRGRSKVASPASGCSRSKRIPTVYKLEMKSNEPLVPDLGTLFQAMSNRASAGRARMAVLSSVRRRSMCCAQSRRNCNGCTMKTAAPQVRVINATGRSPAMAI